MSTASYPIGMKSYNNTSNQGGYKSWKGSGTFSNPVGITPGNIRPLTNNDKTNSFTTGFGLPRPIKHYRKGRAFNYIIEDPNNPGNYIEVNRGVKSSTYGNLIKQTIDQPNSYSISKNTPDETDNINKLNIDCSTCYGIGVISNYSPNTQYLTENPETKTQSSNFCCNQEKKALRRVLPTNTNISKTYFTTLQDYRHNRCQTYDQRIFNFVTDPSNNQYKPGDPYSITNLYVANCDPNGNNSCKKVIYKPNNYQYSKQGAVSSSERILRLNVNTINKNMSNINNTSAFVYKNKTPSCNPSDYYKNGDKKTVCRR